MKFTLPIPSCSNENICFHVGDYSFGFQAQEQDKEMWGGSVTYKYRVEDPRLGRFFSVDPLYAKYSYNSCYAFSENKLIAFKELEGLECAYYSANDESSYSVFEEACFPKYDHGFRVDALEQVYITPEQVESSTLWGYCWENNGGFGHSLLVNLNSFQIWEVNHPKDENGNPVNGLKKSLGGDEKSVGYTFSIYDESFWEGHVYDRGPLEISVILVIDDERMDDFLNAYVGNEFDYNILTSTCKDFCLTALDYGERTDLTESEACESYQPEGFPVRATKIVEPYYDECGDVVLDEENCVILNITDKVQ